MEALDCVDTIVGMCEYLKFGEQLLRPDSSLFARLDGRYSVASAARKRDGKRI